eukprot:12969829-Alexandrium_andersonii.AAC.1
MAPAAGTSSTRPMSACAESAWSGVGAGSRARCQHATTRCAPGAPSSSGPPRSRMSRLRLSGTARSSTSPSSSRP